MTQGSPKAGSHSWHAEMEDLGSGGVSDEVDESRVYLDGFICLIFAEPMRETGVDKYTGVYTSEQMCAVLASIAGRGSHVTLHLLASTLVGAHTLPSPGD